MMHITRNPYADAVVALLGSVGLPAPAEAGPLYDPTTIVNGKTFEEWNVIWTQRQIEESLGGGSSIPLVVDGVRLFPQSGGPGVFEFDVTPLPNMPFIASPCFVYGETCSDPNVPDDTPQLIIDLDVFGTAQITTFLDGAELPNGTGTDLSAYMFGPIYFDSPIVYAEPQYRFDDANGDPVCATAALFTQGIGTIFRPLSVGEHTVHNIPSSPFFGDFDLTCNIRVVPEPGGVVMMSLGVLGIMGLGMRRR